MISAVIFDLDGTVLENEGVWEEAFRTIISKEGFDVEKIMKQENGWLHEPGIGVESNWRVILSTLGKTDEGDRQKLVKDTVQAYKEAAGVGEIKLREGTADLVEEIKEKGWQTALCTGSPWYMVENELEELGLTLAFDITTTGE